MARAITALTHNTGYGAQKQVKRVGLAGFSKAHPTGNRTRLYRLDQGGRLLYALHRGQGEGPQLFVSKLLQQRVDRDNLVFEPILHHVTAELTDRGMASIKVRHGDLLVSAPLMRPVTDPVNIALLLGGAEFVVIDHERQAVADAIKGLIDSGDLPQDLSVDELAIQTVMDGEFDLTDINSWIDLYLSENLKSEARPVVVRLAARHVILNTKK